MTPSEGMKVTVAEKLPNDRRWVVTVELDDAQLLELRAKLGAQYGNVAYALYDPIDDAIKEAGLL